nr:ser-4 [Meloidogyne graminicola]
MFPFILPLLIFIPLFFILISLAFSGNLLVIAAIFYDRKLRKQPENLFLVSLAISDLFVAGMVMVLAATNDLIGFWPFGAAFCQFWICLDIACCTASILNLCAIALDRFIHISRPMRYVRFVGRRVICCSVCAIWVISTAVGTAQIAFGATNGLEINFNNKENYFGEIIENYKNLRLISNNNSSLTQCQLQLSPFYAVFSSFLSFFLPATLMLFLYYRLYLYARHHARSIQTQLKQATSLLILQLASDRVRQVVVHPSNGFLSPSIALHYDSQRFSSNNKKSLNGENFQRAEFSNVNVAMKKSSDSAIINATVQQGTPILCATLRQLKRTESNNSSSFSFLSKNGLSVRKVGERRKSCSPISSPTTKRGRSYAWSSNNNNGSNRSLSSDKKARVTLGIIMGTFLICWLPFFIVNVWRAFWPELFPPLLFQAVSWLGYANSSVNPIIYGIFNRDFRRAFSRIINKLLHCLNDERRLNTNFRTESESV